MKKLSTMLPMFLLVVAVIVAGCNKSNDDNKVNNQPPTTTVVTPPAPNTTTTTTQTPANTNTTTTTTGNTNQSSLDATRVAKKGLGKAIYGNGTCGGYNQGYNFVVYSYDLTASMTGDYGVMKGPGSKITVYWSKPITDQAVSIFGHLGDKWTQRFACEGTEWSKGSIANFSVLEKEGFYYVECEIADLFVCDYYIWTIEFSTPTHVHTDIWLAELWRGKGHNYDNKPLYPYRWEKPNCDLNAKEETNPIRK